jgi:hypothetical protein
MSHCQAMRQIRKQHSRQAEVLTPILQQMLMKKKWPQRTFFTSAFQDSKKVLIFYLQYTC